MTVIQRWPLWVLLVTSSFVLTACYSTKPNNALDFPETASEISQQPQNGEGPGSVRDDLDLTPEPVEQAPQNTLDPLNNTNTQKDDSMNTPANLPQSITELKIETAKPGTGANVESGNTVTAKYKGQLLNGQVFDQGTFSFQVGAGRVIQGWDEGFIGLQEGGQYRLLIPSAMAYGERGAGGAIPPNADLVFDVEVIKVEK